MKSIAAFFVFVVLAGSSAASAYGQNKLTIAMLRSATQTPYYLAADAGIYKSYGLDVQPVQFSGGTQSLMALIAGDVQLNTSGGPAAINAMMKGGGVMIIATNVSVFPYILYANPAIKSAEDLKGKRVGIAGLGGVTHFAMIYALRKLGLNPDSDVTLTTIGDAGARLAAALGGTIAATLVQPPESLKARELGLKPMYDLSKSGVKFPGNQITANLAYLRSNRDSVKRFMMGSIAGLARLKADRPFTMKIMEKYLRISDPRLLSEAYDFWVGVYAPRFRAEPEEIETYFELAKLKARPQDYVDNSIIDELEREGFFEQINKKYGVR